MKPMKRFAAARLAATLSTWACAAALGLLPAAAHAQQAPGAGGYQVGDRLAPQGAAPAGEFVNIEWDELIPADWHPERLFEDLDLDELQDNDPRAMALLERMRAEWDRAPVVQSMAGRRVRLPGFVVPLETDGEVVREFLLVPYFGACVHVPPPPANQLIHVVPDKPVPAAWNMLPVWVEGVLAVGRIESELGHAGYQMRALKVSEYEEPTPR